MILTSPPDNFERPFNWHLARPADYRNVLDLGLCFVTKNIESFLFIKINKKQWNKYSR